MEVAVEVVYGLLSGAKEKRSPCHLEIERLNTNDATAIRPREQN